MSGLFKLFDLRDADMMNKGPKDPLATDYEVLYKIELSYVR